MSKVELTQEEIEALKYALDDWTDAVRDDIFGSSINYGGDAADQAEAQRHWGVARLLLTRLLKGGEA